MVVTHKTAADQTLLGIGAATERPNYLHTVEVTGSNPVSPTAKVLVKALKPERRPHFSTGRDTSFAEGMVEASGPGLAEGLSVVVPV